MVIAENQILDYREAPALWSPDSRYMLYHRDGRIYYASVRHIEEMRLPDESYREFGKGTLNSIRWTGPDSMFYIDGSQVSLIRPSAFFTGSFYDDPLPSGRTTGLIPVDFDPNFDEFWPSSDGSSVIVLTEGRNLFLFPLTAEPQDSEASLPFMLLPRETRVQQLWWRTGGDVLILAGGSRRGDHESVMYRLGGDEGDEARFHALDISDPRRFVPSPDRRILAVLSENEVDFRNPDTLEIQMSIPHPDPRDLFWLNPEQVCIIGAYRSEVVSLTDGRSRLLSLSSMNASGFDGEGNILAESGERRYQLDSGGRIWKELTDRSGSGLRTPRLDSSAYRVYLEDSPSVYANRVNIRTVDGFGNRMLFPDPYAVETLPATDDESLSPAWDPRVFDHGSRTRAREVSLVFNAVDGDEGIGEILNVLDDFGLKSSFFICGDFIRRQPDTTRVLAASEHEIGSLFYTHMDMTDYRYRVDEDFIIRGLGRNEDEFFRVSGREISTMWHAPWYVVSPPILDAGARMNYRYIGRDVDPQDWVVIDGAGGTLNLYKNSADLVEQVLKETRPGSIISVRVGKPGKRDDYFFRKLDLLINALLEDGYDIIPVGELWEHSR